MKADKILEKVTEAFKKTSNNKILTPRESRPGSNGPRTGWIGLKIWLQFKLPCFVRYFSALMYGLWMGFFLREIYYHDSLVMGTINLQKKHIVFPGLVLDQLDHLGRPVPWLGRAHLQLPNRSLPFTPTSYWKAVNAKPSRRASHRRRIYALYSRIFMFYLDFLPLSTRILLYTFYWSTFL